MNSYPKRNNQSGFITTVILIVVALIAAKYAFHFDIVAWIQSPGPQKIIQTSWTWIKTAYAWVDTQVASHLQSAKK